MRCNQMSERESGDNADCQSDDDGSHSLRDNETKHVAGLRAKRHPHTDLAAALPNEVRAGRGIRRSGARYFLEGVIALGQGEEAKAKSSFQDARDYFEKQLVERPNDPSLLSALSMADAGTGRKEDACAKRKERSSSSLCRVTR